MSAALVCVVGLAFPISVWVILSQSDFHMKKVTKHSLEGVEEEDVRT